MRKNESEKGNTFCVASNQYAELNMLLDPVAAKSVFESEVNITLIPLGVRIHHRYQHMVTLTSDTLSCYISLLSLSSLV